MAVGGELSKEHLKQLSNVTSIDGPEFELFRKYVLLQINQRGDISKEHFKFEAKGQKDLIDETKLSTKELQEMKVESETTIISRDEIHPTLPELWTKSEMEHYIFSKLKEKVKKQRAKEVLKKTIWINSKQTLNKAIEDILKYRMIGVDFEFSLPKGKKCKQWIVLIQVATFEKIYVIDVLKVLTEVKEFFAPQVLANHEILKVVLGASQDVLHCAKFLSTLIIHTIDLQAYIKHIYSKRPQVVIDIFEPVLFDKWKETTTQKYFYDRAPEVVVGSEIIFKALYQLDQGHLSRTDFSFRNKEGKLHLEQLVYAASDAEFTLKSFFKLNHELIKRGVSWDEIEKFIIDSYEKTKDIVQKIPIEVDLQFAKKDDGPSIISLFPDERKIFQDIYYMLIQMGYCRFIKINGKKPDKSQSLNDSHGYYFQFFSLNQIAEVSRNINDEWIGERKILFEQLQETKYKEDDWFRLADAVRLLCTSIPLPYYNYDGSREWTDLEEALIAVGIELLQGKQVGFIRNEIDCRNCMELTHVARFCLMDKSKHKEWLHLPKNKGLQNFQSFKGAISFYLKSGKFPQDFRGTIEPSVLSIKIDEFLTNRQKEIRIWKGHRRFFFDSFKEAVDSKRVNDEVQARLTGTPLRRSLVLLYDAIQQKLPKRAKQVTTPKGTFSLPPPKEVDDVIMMSRFESLFNKRKDFKEAEEMMPHLKLIYQYDFCRKWLFNIITNFE